MLIRPVQSRPSPPPLESKAIASGWQLYRCQCCGPACRRLRNRGEVVEPRYSSTVRALSSASKEDS